MRWPSRSRPSFSLEVLLAARRRPPRPAALRLEALEDRSLPSTWTVTNLLDSGSGSLRDQIAQAQEGDTIDFAADVRGTITLTSGKLVLGHSVSITGPGADLLSISGNHALQVFRVSSGVAVSLTGLTITNGNMLDPGGIVSEVGPGGGIGVDLSATLTVSSCTLSGNSARSGGAIANFGNLLTVSNCTLSGNSTALDAQYGYEGYGGAIGNFGHLLTVSNCTLSGNFAGSDGGAIANGSAARYGFPSGQVTVTGCTLSGNSVRSGYFGGGIFSSSGTLTVSNSTLSGNSGTFGAGINTFYNPGRQPTTLTVSNSTLSGNSGSAIYNTGTATLQSTIVAGNGYDLVSNNVASSSSYNLIGTGGSGGLMNGVNHNLVGVANPGLGSLADNGGPTRTILLLPGSPAIGAGDPALAGTPDQRGVLRGTPVSIGAFQGTTLTVTTLSDSGAGSLREKVGLAGNGDSINFQSGLSGTITLTSGELLLQHIVTLSGPGAGTLTVSGNNTSRVFEVAAGTTVSLTGLTISDGRVSSTSRTQGGGLLNAGNLTLTDCRISNNQSAVTMTGTGSEDVFAQGGGICTSGPLTLVRCTVVGNSANLSAGNLDYGQANGGGLYSNGGTVTLGNSTVAGNSATGTFAGGTGFVFAYGGGLTSDNGTVNLTGCTVAGNTATGGNGAGYGGGVHSYQSTVSLSNSTIANNTASSASDSGLGGGVSDLDSNLTLTSCTITGNGANSTASIGSGGGLYYNSSAGSAQVLNTIVAGNTSGTDGPDASGSFASLGSNLIGISDGSTGWGSSDLTGTASSPLDPMLGTLGSHGGPTQTVPLLAGSPALNAGDPAQLGSADQRGLTRRGGVNIGAFQASAAQLTFTDPGQVSLGVPFQLVVTATDVYGNVAVGYTGTVVLSRSDGPGPLEYAFTAADAGMHAFTVTVDTPGLVSFLLRDRDDNSIRGDQIDLSF
jgi:hypothetical protein